jgi:type VI secretion system protein ImpE
MIFGQPAPWLALLIESLLRAGRGEAALSAQLRADAFDQAEAVGGVLDGKPFSWIADADSRLGPVLEVIINGMYYWLPFAHLRTIVLDEPHDLRDVVWMPAHFLLANGGEAVGLVPTRYPGSENAAPALALARQTEWIAAGPDAWHGLGQRMLVTDAGEAPLMEVRKIELAAPAEQG